MPPHQNADQGAHLGAHNQAYEAGGVPFQGTIGYYTGVNLESRLQSRASVFCVVCVCVCMCLHAA